MVPPLSKPILITLYEKARGCLISFLDFKEFLMGAQNGEISLTSDEIDYMVSLRQMYPHLSVEELVNVSENKMVA